MSCTHGHKIGLLFTYFLILFILLSKLCVSLWAFEHTHSVILYLW